MIHSLRAEVAFLLKEQANSFQRIEEIRPTIAADTLGKSLLSALGLGRGVPDYPEHEIRKSFYFQLARISRSNVSIEAHQMGDLLAKLLARIIGETLGSYYLWCKRNRCVFQEIGYPLHSGNPNILWLGSRGLGVPVGDDRSIRRWVHGDCLLHKAVEEFSPAA